jgi:bacillolysin
MRSCRALSSVVTLGLLLGLCTATSSATAAVEAPSRVSVPVATGPVHGDDAAEADERRLRADAEAPVVVAEDPDGEATFLATRGAPVTSPASRSAPSAAAAARAHVQRYDALLGVDDPATSLTVADVVPTGGGDRLVQLDQEVDGLPVLGGELVVAVDAEGGLESVNGETADAPAGVAAPLEPASAATRTALVSTARSHGVRVRDLLAGRATRWWFDPALVGSPDPLGPRAVWRVQVTDRHEIDRLVLIDAATGLVADSVDQAAHAGIVVCNRPDQARSGGLGRPCRRPYARTTRAAEPAGQVARAFEYAADTRDLYRTLGQSLTALVGHNAGDGRKVRLTVNLPGDNAFWNGRGAYFSRGYAKADDVVAHELTHGVIERLSGLAYWYQSGAINESIADVFGEIVDQRNGGAQDTPANAWLAGEDLPGGELRDMARPSRLRVPGVPRQPDRMRSRFYFADTRLRDNGAVHINSGVGNKAAYLISEGGRFNGTAVGAGIDDGDDRVKTARLYLRVLPMLTSGSDYADLGRLLPQACRGLVGRHGFAAGDCGTVRRAVTATQMLVQPRVATAPEAPRCSPANARSRRLFRDTMERPSRRVWRLGRLWRRLPGRPGAAPFQPYATSGRRSLFGLNPDPQRGMPARSSVTLKRGIRVPARGRTYLRFDHARLFEYAPARERYYDGGLVEYSVGGRRWTSASGLRWANGPRQRIVLGRGPSGFRGFGGDSHGYVSSRLDLTRFRGRTVRLRWTVASDPVVGFFGWWLDDVEAFTCRG